ncbi:hypothetical protein [Desulfovibrio inopinatus]|uniref:hypothetical protein n=1 Tax=Desulfovibrio inopinatus TaxID=102109 RepID=UPI0005540806|nr:hypothetical protein [Desulfovibrio inopinatus]
MPTIIFKIDLRHLLNWEKEQAVPSHDTACSPSTKPERRGLDENYQDQHSCQLIRADEVSNLNPEE